MTITAGGLATGTQGAIRFRTGTGGVDRLYINGDGSWGLAAAATVGTAGQVLTSQGAAPPIWTTPASTPTTISLADGSNIAPTLRYISETNTGLYRAGAGIIGFATAGATGALLSRGILNLIGGGAGAANTSYVSFLDSASVTIGNVGDMGGSDSHITLAASASGANVVITAGSGGIVNMTSAAQAPSFTSTSSRKIKRETGTPKLAASILAKLRPLLYRLLDGDDREQLGLIAEEVREVCPQLSDGKAVAYDRLAILLLAAWQEEHAEAA